MAADHVVAGQAHHRQYVSGPLSAQTISGSVKAQFQALEAHANNNLNLTLKIWVCTNDGTGQRGSNLLDRTSKGTEPTTALRNTAFSTQALTNSVAVQAGDRLVVEVGFNGTPTATSGTQGHNASLRFGETASGGDLPENETEAGTTFRPWIEFTSDITLDTTITPQTGALVLAGVQPAVINPQFRTPVVGALTIVGIHAVRTNYARAPPAGQLYFGIETNRIITPPSPPYSPVTFTGYAPVLSVSGGGATTITPNTATLRIGLFGGDWITPDYRGVKSYRQCADCKCLGFSFENTDNWRFKHRRKRPKCSGQYHAFHGRACYRWNSASRSERQ